jgi:GNAT superfamily N-acetyltransferase
MLPPPVPYTVRPAEVNESGAIAALIAVCDRAVDALPSYIESDLLDDWRRNDFVLDRDTWVVESPDNEIVGYAEIACEGPTLASFGAVHPDHRRRGLGSYLIDRIEERALVHPARTRSRGKSSEHHLARQPCGAFTGDLEGLRKRAHLSTHGDRSQGVIVSRPSRGGDPALRLSARS